MKVAIVSSWAPRECGIAIYSADLVRALAKIGVDVEIVCHIDGQKSSNTHPIINTNNPTWPEELSAQLEIISPDIVHIQHEYGLFTSPSKLGFNFTPANSFPLSQTIFDLKTKSIPTVITFHSVYSKMTFEEVEYLDIFCRLAQASVVHESFQKKALIRYLGQGLDKSITAIPHGTWAGSDVSKVAAKLANGWQNNLVVGMIGYLEKTKGFDRIIKIWPKIVSKIPNALLVIEGNARPGSPSGKDSVEKIEKAIEQSPAKENIKFYKKLFVWPANNQFISGFDLMVLPYIFASQSGNLAHAYGAGLPVVASDLEGVGSSVRESRAGLLAKSDQDFEKAIIYLLKNSAARKKFAQNSSAYAKKIDWEIIAHRHLEVYRTAIAKNRHNSQDFKKYLENRTHV